MGRFATVIVSAAASAMAMSSVATGVASAAPSHPIPGFAAADDPSLPFVNVVNSGKVAQVVVKGRLRDLDQHRSRQI